MITSKKIEISYIWDEDNFNKAFNRSYEYEYKNSPRRYIGWFFIALSQLGVIFAFRRGTFGLLLFSSLVLLYWYIIKRYLVKNRALKEFRRSPLKDKKITLRVDEKGVYQEENFISWDEIGGALVINKDIFLYIDKKPYYIPKSGFKSDEDRNCFVNLLRTKDKIDV